MLADAERPMVEADVECFAVERPRAFLVRPEAHHPEADARDAQARAAEVHELHGRKLSADGCYLRERASAITAASSSRIGATNVSRSTLAYTGHIRFSICSPAGVG